MIRLSFYFFLIVAFYILIKRIFYKRAIIKYLINKGGHTILDIYYYFMNFKGTSAID